ncbi:MaoC family dehydratase [candidate division KSB1 bacterium]|nr:MAG: MaoC family dehydratase [candidate division KSB1 bacterium]
MSANLAYTRTLEHFKTGQVFHHLPHKTVMESDNNLFCLLTMCHHPIHSDIEFARQSQHGKPLVVGTYVFSLIAAMTVPDISGAAIANLEYEKIEHNGPVFIGDTLRAETEVLDVRPSKSKPDRGIIYVETRGYNQRNELVLTFRRRVLIRTEMPESYRPDAY